MLFVILYVFVDCQSHNCSKPIRVFLVQQGISFENAPNINATDDEYFVITSSISEEIRTFLNFTRNSLFCEGCDVHKAFSVALNKLKSLNTSSSSFSFSTACTDVTFDEKCIPKIAESRCPSKFLPRICSFSVASLRHCQAPALLNSANMVARVIPQPSDSSCPVLSIFRGVGSIPVRMLLELYVGQPIAVRSFFHGNLKDTFLHHQYDPPVRNRSIVIYSNPVSQAYSLCGGNVHRGRTISCIEVQTLLYARYAIAALVGRFSSTIVRFEDWLSDSFLHTILSAIPVRCYRVKADFDPIAAQSARDFLLDEQSSGGIRAAHLGRVQGDPEQSTFTRSLHNGTNTEWLEFERVYGSTILYIFIEAWKDYLPALEQWFPEIDVKAKYSKLSPVPPQIYESQHNDVHVLMPTKKPTDLGSCIDSLVTNTNFAFGGVHFHFGVDWGDEATTTAIAKAFKSRPNLHFRIHQVFNRASDVSAIVNHMFALNTNGRYFLRFNDDSRMKTRNWNEEAILALRTEPIDVGIAIIHDPRNRKLQTHSFVSYMHKKFFGGLYFPVHFRNYFEDDWITVAYPTAWRKPTSIQIEHRFENERYQIHRTTPEALEDILVETNLMVQDAIARLRLLAPLEFRLTASQP
jgi:hypothetical protein